MKKARSLSWVLVLVFVLTLASSLASPAQANMGGPTSSFYINGDYPERSEDEITLYTYITESDYGESYMYNVVYLKPGDTITVVNDDPDGKMEIFYEEYKKDPSLKNATISSEKVDLSNSYAFVINSGGAETDANRHYLHSDGTWALGDPARMPDPKNASSDQTYFLPRKVSFTFPESASKDVYFLLTVYTPFSIDDFGEYLYYSDEIAIRLIGDKTLTPVVDPPAPEVIPSSPKVVPTNQKLTVDGVAKNTEIYNIDGSNYFKLRDIAALLNGTDAQFSVDYDPDIKMIDICIGEPYESVGGELTVGTDKSASAVPSSQQIRVNMAHVDLTAYNIGGNNFFKLRDLGDALNFDVDYDSATRTILINTVYSPAWDHLKSLGKVQIENGAGYVYITLPEDFVNEGITQEQIDAGAGKSYTAAKLNQDGSLTYKLNKTQHKAFLDSAAETIENSLREVTDNPAFGIGNIFCYDDYSFFNVYLETDEIGFNEEYLDMAFYILGGMYSLYAGYAPDRIIVNYYAQSGYLLQTDSSAD